LVFLIAYPITFLRLGKIHVLLAVFVGAMFVVGKPYVRLFLQKYLVDSQYSGYLEQTAGLSFAGFIIQVLMFIFCMYYYSEVSKKYKTANILYNLAFLGILFQLFSSMIAEIFRISMYFSFFNIILIPMAISVEREKRIQAIETVAIIGAFFVYMLSTGIPPYSFFWW
jgi:hypothetical protein